MTAPVLRTATPDEIETMLDWAAAEGWNPGLDDAGAFRAADPEGFFVAELDGAPVAAISVVNHSDDFAFLGFYICRPAFRGKGIGYRLWQHGLRHAGTRTVGLDGVADQEENYARSGFVRTGASLRLEGALDGQPAADVRPVEASDLDGIDKLDAAVNGYARRAFLSTWLEATPTRRSFVLQTDQGFSGFATLRRCRDGVKIGPVVAGSTGEVILLVRAGLAAMPSEKVILDLPSANEALHQHLLAKGFSQTFATARMFRGTAPQSGPLLQAIATMELG